ncbi:MAG: SGNH/GDSL hydrolase family protein [Bacteroidetes bacterium]|nr:SGNH/GDSL hydrolase family protein [Bacteroidota bacterium]
MYRNFRIVEQLQNLPTQYSDETGIVRYLRNGYHPADFQINLEGFRSQYEYDSATIRQLKQEGKKIVMVVGDSYVAGHTATPITNCFSDLLDSDSVASLNFGVVGTDPAQYELVCREYLPIIKPDIVLVCVYANDFLTFKRRPSPGTPIMYRTNASPNGGMIFSQKPFCFGYQPNDLFKSAEEAYRFYERHYTLRNSEQILAVFCSYSSLLTVIYNFIHPKKFSSRSVEVAGRKDARAKQILYSHLKEIQTICIRNNSRVLYFGIPANGEIIREERYVPDVKDESITIQYPTDFDRSDYSNQQGDGHLNNKGHLKYMRYLLKKTGIISQKNSFSTADYRQ